MGVKGTSLAWSIPSSGRVNGTQLHQNSNLMNNDSILNISTDFDSSRWNILFDKKMFYFWQFLTKLDFYAECVIIYKWNHGSETTQINNV